MRKGLFIFVALAVVTALAFAPSAQAQATRTWVSGVGDDANPCSRTAPCKTYAGAISKTAAGGEISTLDPGGFGSVTITKSITINGDATIAGVLASLTQGVVINAGVNDKVTLRNLAINGAGNGTNGIRFLNGNQVTVENCWIQGFTTRAIDVALADAAGLNLRSLILRNVLITNNTATTTVRIANTSLDDFTRVTMENTSIVGNSGIGFEAAQGAVRVLIKNSMIAHNGNDGIRASGASTEINVEDSGVASNNGFACNASVSGARIRISQNTITNNTNAFNIAAGAFIDSANNNRVAGNGGATVPNGTYTQQ